jgi:NRAMP (natural resistance-associated macrophage protein)-like metal ion transporter
MSCLIPNPAPVLLPSLWSLHERVLAPAVPIDWRIALSEPPLQAHVRQPGPGAPGNPKSILQYLGPGLITGAADDDPSGIATYSQVGAQFGLGMLWTMLFSFPLMAAMQEICARLGRITGGGIAENLRKHYPKPVLYGLVALLCLANIFNLGADVTAMGAAAQLVFGGSLNAYALAFGLLSLVLQMYVPYKRYVRYLRWLTLTLFAYVATAFVVHVPWKSALHATLVPSVSWTANYWMALVGVLGTTISPYLFFWQTSEEAEDVRLNKGEQPLNKKPSQASGQFHRIAIDTRVGMGFSNLVAFFIILTTAVTLHTAGAGNKIQTSADAAKALQPLAGNLAFLLFAVGIIGTGLLAVPVLAGSAAYAVAETFRWRASLESTPRQTPKFYVILAAATVIGISLNFLGMDPIHALFWSAVINGVVAVPLMVMLMIMSANSAIVGKFPLPAHLHIIGWIATGVMLLASLAFIVSGVHGLF